MTKIMDADWTDADLFQNTAKDLANGIRIIEAAGFVREHQALIDEAIAFLYGCVQPGQVVEQELADAGAERDQAVAELRLRRLKFCAAFDFDQFSRDGHVAIFHVEIG